MRRAGIAVGLVLLALGHGCSDDSDDGEAGSQAPATVDAGGQASGGADAGPDDVLHGPDGEPLLGPDGGLLTEVYEGEFSALTYNVAGLPEGLSQSMPLTYTPMISPLLNAYDIVLVQEDWLTPEDNPLAPLRVYHELLVESIDHPYQSIPDTHPLNMDPDRPTAIIGDGLNRFSRYPFEPVIRVHWARCVDTAADCLAFKGFSVGRTTFASDVVMDIYNLHMEAGGSDEDVVARDEDIDQLLAFLLDYSEGRAVIIGGDFNLHTDQEPDMGQFERLLAEGELEDSCAVLDCEDPGRIDKFLFRSSEYIEITPTGYRVESDTFVTEDGLPLSDHDPVNVRFAYSALR